MRTSTLKVRDVERLENTSIASALLGLEAGMNAGCTEDCTGVIFCYTWDCNTNIDPSYIHVGYPSTIVLPTNYCTAPIL